jgi:peptide/nickel transport system substrate-binding protein
MHLRPRIPASRPLLAAAITLVAVLTPALGMGTGVGRATAASPVYVTSLQTGAATFQRNFNPFMTAARRDFTNGAIYEPLMIITTAGKGHTYPWLATKYAWTNHNKSLLVTLRSGVKWSDGKPFTSADVVFTFAYGKKYATADETGLMQKGIVTSVKAKGPNAVLFTFKTVNTTVLPQLLSTNTMIIPQHIWAKVKNPDTWTNPNPVGTGPFTKIVKFTSQLYILGKNPYYWQKLNYDGIKVPALPDNTSALAAAVTGQLDWSPNKFDNVQTSYVAKDSKHFHAYYKDVAYPLGLYFNDEAYPFTLPVLRQAISLAIDRQKINTIAEAGLEPPADGLGMAKLWPSWVDPKLKAQAKAMTTLNPTKAKSLLTAAGFTYKGSSLYDPKGNAVSINLSCPAGWDDWVSSLQIIQQNLQAIGVDANVTQSDQTAWLDNRSKRLLTGGFFWAPGTGVNPYNFFNSFMSKDSYFPVGQNALASGLANLSGWYSTSATTMLAQYRQSASQAKQQAIAYKLEKIMLTNMPFVPTVYAPYWYTYSTLHFTGFPTAKNYYAHGASYLYPDDVKILTSLNPVK